MMTFPGADNLIISMMPSKLELGYGAIPQMWLVSVGTFHMMSDSHEFS